MGPNKTKLKERIAILRSTGVPVTSADEERVGDSIAISLRSLDAAVKDSLFDTEPQTLDVTLRELANNVRS